MWIREEELAILQKMVENKELLKVLGKDFSSFIVKVVRKNEEIFIVELRVVTKVLIVINLIDIIVNFIEDQEEMLLTVNIFIVLAIIDDVKMGTNLRIIVVLMVVLVNNIIKKEKTWELVKNFVKVDVVPILVLVVFMINII